MRATQAERPLGSAASSICDLHVHLQSQSSTRQHLDSAVAQASVIGRACTRSPLPDTSLISRHLLPDQKPAAMVLGRLTHYAFDAVLFSAFLAGVKRSTGLTLSSDRITDSKDIKRWIDSYLGVGEWVMDQSVAVLGASGYFERRRNPEIADLLNRRE